MRSLLKRMAANLNEGAPHCVRHSSFNERRALDVYYVQNWTIALDIQIFFRTIASILRQEGAR